MRELLAVFGPTDGDAELLDEIARLHPRRVTVLLEGVKAGWAHDDSRAGVALRDRLAALLAAIERRCGATVTGLAGGRAQLEGWRFDREIAVRMPIPA